MLVIGDRFIETAMFNPMRRIERFPVRHTLAGRLEGCRVMALPEPVSLPEDEAGSLGPGPFLEGGDLFVLGVDIYVGVSGNASNAAGIQSLRHILGESYRVHEIGLSSGRRDSRIAFSWRYFCRPLFRRGEELSALPRFGSRAPSASAAARDQAPS